MSRPLRRRSRRRKSRSVKSGSSGSGPMSAKTRAAADLGDELAGDRVAAVQPDLPELADVAEAQLAAVLELEDEPDVRVLRRLGRDHEQLAGHLEMDGQRGIPGQLDDELLRPPSDRLHSTPRHGIREGDRVVRLRSVRAHDTRAPTIVAPTRRGRRSRATVSTSGSSGIGRFGQPVATVSAGVADAAAPGGRGTGRIDSQSSPAFTSTVSGTSSGIAVSIVSRTSATSSSTPVARDLEQQLVVDLEQHPRRRARGRQPLGDADHRDLHDVGGRALDRHVDGHPLPRPAQRRDARLELRDRALAAEQRRHVALLLGDVLDVEHVVADARVGREVVRDERLRLLAADARPGRQPEVAHPVGDPEVDHLGHRALVRRDVGRAPCGGRARRSRGGCPPGARRRP